jgi:hypothetical protein
MAASAATPEPPTLQATIAALDTAVFDAFNHCADPAQLQAHAAHFAPDVEFYHDTGGVTWTRDAMIANTAKYACGHYTRELAAGSLQVGARVLFSLHDIDTLHADSPAGPGAAGASSGRPGDPGHELQRRHHLRRRRHRAVPPDPRDIRTCR